MKYQKILSRLERIGDVYFVDKAKVKLGPNFQQFIVMVLPWFIALTLLVLIPLIAFGLVLGASSWLAGAGDKSPDRIIYYISLLVLGAETAAAARAVPLLSRFQRQGWKLLFYVLLAHLGYALLRWTAETTAFLSLLWTWGLALACLYVLFQIKHRYQR